MIEIDKGVAPPKAFLNLFATHQFSRLFQQTKKHLERLRVKFDLYSVLAQLSRVFIYLENPKLKDAARQRFSVTDVLDARKTRLE